MHSHALKILSTPLPPQVLDWSIDGLFLAGGEYPGIARPKTKAMRLSHNFDAAMNELAKWQSSFKLSRRLHRSRQRQTLKAHLWHAPIRHLEILFELIDADCHCVARTPLPRMALRWQFSMQNGTTWHNHSPPMP